MTESFAPAFFEDVVAAVGVGVVVYDEHGYLVSVSDAYAALFDVDTSALVGTALWRIDHALDPERFAAHWNAVDEAGTRRAEATHEVDGRSVPVTTVTTHRSVDGDAYHFVAVTDRREDERREAAMAARDDYLDAFAAVVTDDLRDPLDDAQGCINRLAADVDDRAEIGLLDGALDRMEALVDNLDTRARDDGALTDPDPVPVGEVATAAWVTVDARGATLDRALVDHELRADPTQLQQLFEHLFRNSVEHSSTGLRSESADSVEHGSTGPQQEAADSVEHGSTGPQQEAADSVEHGSTDLQQEAADSVEHGSTGPQQEAADSVEHGSTPAEDERATAVTITVGALADGFYVADDGPGIPAERRERVFEAGVSGDVDGAGIGLRIVAEIADTHGWTVTLTESAAGGARFEFRAEESETRERAP
ncbi:signal transduction histidine kinase [Halarchaeum rubridurum]|uniref:histidine kinase n=1 Tax=Halarchaeum rubridurum TaxID=489911 RepID=A0A830G2S5_9EURY|nr:HAMP domain-containing sensor histidine kinase [Halarchaeum rubridurum]MBP1955442.1 signal transduction histidine kinase [Halarchaeum rubridurum]GGM72397.1 hypothetical protein GCM10009017_22950 [Halarchaeum rubridurum]